MKIQKNNPLKIIRKNTKTLKGLFLTFGLFFCGNFALAAQIDLPRDENGWTIFTPSDDSRIMYVSVDGDDSTGAIYDNDDAALGGNPFNPTSNINSFATYAAAFANTRQGYPDWILIRRGDVFYESIGTQTRSGRSFYEPFLISAYGDAGESPEFRTGAGSGFSKCCGGFQWIAISGISFYAHTRNPESPEYVPGEGSVGFNFYVGDGSTGQGLLIEGCKLRFYTSNVIQGPGNVNGIVLRRSVILDNYNDGSHSQGLYTNNVSILLEENIFDHNGWYSQSPGTPGKATIFNHNTYFSGTKNSSFVGNIFLRPSSIQNKFTANGGEASAENILIDNNLYVDGEVGMSIGGNETGPRRFKNVAVKNNVMTNIGRSRPTNRDLGWMIDVIEWDGGEVKNNYLLNQPNSTGNNYGLHFIGSNENVTIDGNVIYNLRNAKGVIIDDLRAESTINMVFSNNSIQLPRDSEYVIDMEYDPQDKWTFSGNRYYSDRFEDVRYRLSGVNQTLEEWRIATGDNSVFEQASFFDQNRSIETYMASLGETANIDTFISEARAQNRYNWDSKYTADVVNSWIRTGFVTAEFRSDVDGSSEISTTDALLTLRNSLGLSMNGTAWRASATTGDVNCDGSSNSTDALLILRYSLGLSMSGTTWCE